MSLLAPLFLLGAFAIGLPLWLHRLDQEDPKHQPFSSVMLLEPGPRRVLLRRRLRYLLLLALRCAVLVLLAIVFAKPIWRHAAAPDAGDTGARHTIIVVDTSLSMGQTAHWQRALATARSLVESLPPAVPATLVAAGGTVQILAGPGTDRSALLAGLQTLRPTPEATDYGAMLEALNGLVREREVRASVHLISDMQQSALPERFADLAPDAGAELVLHDVAETAAANFAITAADYDARTAQLTVMVRGFNTAATQKTVTATLNGNALPPVTVAIPANASATATLPVPVSDLRKGFNRLQIALSPGDELAADDTRHALVEYGTTRRLLVLTSEPDARDAVFLDTAAEALPDLNVERVKQPITELPDEPLTAFDGVIVLDGGALPAATGAAIEAYVRGGGTVLLGAGPRSAGQAQLPLTGQKLLAGGMPAGTSARRFVSVGAGDASHPVVGPVEAWRGIRIFRHIPVEPLADDQVLLQIEDGSPLLLESRIGNSDAGGRVLWFMSSLDNDWNDLPVQPLFLAFVHDVATYLAGGAGLPRSAEPGDALALRGTGGGQVIDPDGAEVLGLAGTLTGDNVSLTKTGIYEVRRTGSTEFVAVNPAIGESDLTPMGAATLERWRATATGAASGPTSAPGTGAAAATTVTPIWRWLLAALALLALAEAIVGHWHLVVRRELA